MGRASLSSAPSETVPRVAPQIVHETTPALGWYSDHVLFDRIWNRPVPDRADRSVLTVSALIAGGNFAQLKGHFGRALDHGLTAGDLAELVTHLAFATGWPAAMSATRVLRDVLDARGSFGSGVEQPLPEETPPRAVDGSGVSADAGELLESVVGPLLRHAEGGPLLGRRRRALATISAMVATGQWEAFDEAVAAIRKEGVEDALLPESLLHLAFYVGTHRARKAAARLDGRRGADG